MKRQVEAYLGRLIKITPKPAVSGAQSKPGKPGATPTTTTSTSKPVSEGKPSIQSSTPGETKSADSTTVQTDPKDSPLGETESAHSATPQADPKENPLAAALQAKRRDLKPTEVCTV